ncbi:MAG: hypothetical protein WD651_12405 [Acidimicrobiia bacterium]
MGRLRRFSDYRFIGRRDEMLVYDCDDPDQFAVLESAVTEWGLDTRDLLSSFAPDTISEARNRGFRAPRSGESGPPPGS